MSSAFGYYAYDDLFWIICLLPLDIMHRSIFLLLEIVFAGFTLEYSYGAPLRVLEVDFSC